jgi:hypothetical protein
MFVFNLAQRKYIYYCLSIAFTFYLHRRFQAGNIEYTDVVVSLSFGVKTVIDSLYQPVKQTVVQRLGHSVDGIHHLQYTNTINT